jgi:hypothetical protein
MTDKRDRTPAEDSVPLRLVVFLMTMTCICASCIFVKTAWPVFVLSVALAGIGSVVSYQYRNDKQGWMQWVVIVGVFAVGANAAAEFMDPTNGASDFWGPVVHFIAGTFALHTFDLKSRSDINLSALLGALILCFLSPVVRSFYFGLAVFNYICLGTVMLYYDCMSRTLHNWLEKPMQPAPVVDVANTSGRRKPRGSVYFTVALLPLISALGFLMVPRSDNLVDNVMSSLKHMDVGAILRMMPGFQPTMPNINMPHHEFTSPFKNRIEMKRKKHELENQDEVDKKLQEMGVDKRKLVKVPVDKAKEEEERKKKEKEEQAKKDKEKQKKEQEKKAKSAKEQKKAPPAHGKPPKSDRPKDNKIGNESLDLDTDPPDSQLILYKVTSTRLIYSRHAVFDVFDGRLWKRSKAKIKVTEIQAKEPGAISAKDASATGSGTATDSSPDASATASTTSVEASAEEEANKELEQEKLNELAKRDTGFGPDMNVDYVFNDPPKGDFHLNLASALRTPSKLPSFALSQNFEMACDADSFLPSAWLPQQVSFKGKKLIVDDYGQIIAPDNLKKGTRFNVNSQWPVYNLMTMRAEPALTEEREKQIREQLANYLELPDSISPEVLDLAETYAGKTGNWYTTAERICQSVRSGCVMEAEKPYDYKPAEDRVKDFLLVRKAGNHKDFTSSYVLLCRAVGLPARVVYGFNPGTFNKSQGVQEVRMVDAMSWAEVFIPDYGWVPFDATPGGVMPSVKREEGFSVWTIFKWLCQQMGISLDEGWTPKAILTMVSIVFSSLFLLAGLILGLVLFLKHRKNALGKNPWQDAAWKVWRDLAKDFKKARMERMPSETGAEFVQRVKKIVADQRRDGAMTGYELPNALEEFFTTYEAVHFGNKDGLPVLKSQAAELRKLVKANKGSEKASQAASKAVRGGRR